MADAKKVARYFLSQADEDAGDVISNLKLQKLMYYAQGFSYALFGRPLFPDDLYAWTHGPVVPSVYYEYKQHQGGAIPAPTDFDPEELSPEERELLAEVYTVYGQYSAWKLRNMTHAESPWVDAYNRAPGSVIPASALMDFFKTLTR